MPILIVLALAGFCSALSVRMLDPLVTEIAREFAADPKTVTLLATAFALPYAIGQPILGPLGDALGKARVIQGCMLVAAVGLAACALAPSLEALFVARVVTGLASGGIIPLSFAMVGDRFGVEQRQVALSKVLAAILSGGIGGGLIAGEIGARVGWRAVAWIVCGLTLLAVVATLSGLRPRRDAPRPGLSISRLKGGYAEVFANPLSIICFAAVFAEGMFVFGMMPYLAIILETKGSGSIREAGYMIASFGLGGIVFTFMVGSLLKMLGGQLNMIRAGGMVAALALMVIALVKPWPVEALAFAIFGLGFYMIHNSLQTRATELAPGARGSAVALHAFFFFLGHAAAPIVFGLMQSSIGADMAIITSAVAMLIIGLATAAGLARADTPRSP